MVTIDAMHTQVATARLICSTLKSHYLMIVKSNQPTLLARIQALPWNQVPVVHREEPQRCDGRTETRTLKVVTAPRGIGFPHARQMIQMTRERITGTGERSVEVVYGICSAAFELARPAMIAAWLRDHWGIENAVHWVRDVTFDEDRCTVRTGAAPQVLASLRNTTLNLHRLHGATTSPKPAAPPPSALTGASTCSQIAKSAGHKRASQQRRSPDSRMNTRLQKSATGWFYIF